MSCERDTRSTSRSEKHKNTMKNKKTKPAAELELEFTDTQTGKKTTKVYPFCKELMSMVMVVLLEYYTPDGKMSDKEREELSVGAIFKDYLRWRNEKAKYPDDIDEPLMNRLADAFYGYYDHMINKERKEGKKSDGKFKH